MHDLYPAEPRERISISSSTTTGAHDSLLPGIMHQAQMQTIAAVARPEDGH
jgi:hypothetical protein